MKEHLYTIITAAW